MVFQGKKNTQQSGLSCIAGDRKMNLFWYWRDFLYQNMIAKTPYLWSSHFYYSYLIYLPGECWKLFPAFWQLPGVTGTLEIAAPQTHWAVLQPFHKVQPRFKSLDSLFSWLKPNLHFWLRLPHCHLLAELTHCPIHSQVLVGSESI